MLRSRSRRTARSGSTRQQQVLDSYRERQQSKKVNPAVRYCESSPHADQTNADNGHKPNVLTCNDAARRRPPGKEKGQEKSIINIRDSEGRDARGHYPQILIHRILSPCVKLASWIVPRNSHCSADIFSRCTQRSRALLTDSRNLRASSAMRSGCRRRIASFGINSAPTPSAIAPASIKLYAVRWFTPPAAIIGT